jgi:hypothetical protein
VPPGTGTRTIVSGRPPRVLYSNQCTMHGQTLPAGPNHSLRRDRFDWFASGGGEAPSHHRLRRAGRVLGSRRDEARTSLIATIRTRTSDLHIKRETSLGATRA